MADVTIAASFTGTGLPMNGVGVRIYSGASLYTSGVTGEGANADGERLFDLPAGDYTMRLFAGAGYSVVSPQAFTVTGVPEDDVFDVSVEVVTRPVAPDPNFCRCSGYVIGPDGAVAKNYNISLTLMDSPVILGAALVGVQKVYVTTDNAGYAVVDLIRGGVYRVEPDGYIGSDLFTQVPALSSANLPDVVFQTVTSVVFSPASVALAIGESVDVAVTVRYRSGLELDLSDVRAGSVSFSSTGLVQVAVNSGHLTLTGAAEGSDTVSVERVLSSTSPVVVYPAEEVTGSLTAVVSAG